MQCNCTPASTKVQSHPRLLFTWASVVTFTWLCDGSERTSFTQPLAEPLPIWCEDDITQPKRKKKKKEGGGLVNASLPFGKT